MNKEIRIINYVFKIKEKINLISIEQFQDYQEAPAKIKLILGNDYFEKIINNVNIQNDKLCFDESIINLDSIDIKLENHQIKLKINNKELINDYQKTNIKNNYKNYDLNIFDGKINEEEVSGKIFLDYEVIKTIPDEYYKIYTIDFENFNGSFNSLFHDEKGIYLNLMYKDEVFKNKKVLSVRKNDFFKLSNIKLKCSGHFLWTININQIKRFKSLPSIIPFKYVKCNTVLQMKKKLFKTDLKALSKENLLITYQFK